MKSNIRLAEFKELLVANSRLSIAVVVAIAGLIFLQGYIQSASQECLGIADSKEIAVAYETPVVVKRIFVLPGQAVRKGQPLVEVEPDSFNLDMLELQGELETLQSEKTVRDMLHSSWSETKSQSSSDSPIGREIAGLQKRLEAMKRIRSQAVRYAEEDGVVATVNYRERERVQPFLPVLTLAAAVPNLVYGYIHEGRLAEFRLGASVTVESISPPLRSVKGQIVSIGSRVTPFPARFQPTASSTQIWGRELLVSLPFGGNLLMGEKVRIRADGQRMFGDMGALAFADDQNSDSETVASELPIEAGGLVFDATTQLLLIVGDDNGPNHSPFWTLPIDPVAPPTNLSMQAPEKIDDIESLTSVGGKFYALGSLSKDSDGHIRRRRNLLVRFTYANNVVTVDKVIEMRKPLIDALATQPVLVGIANKLDELDVEAFAMDENNGYFGLKSPRLKETIALIRINNLLPLLDGAGPIENLDAEVRGLMRLETNECKKFRISDLVKTPTGMLFLTYCKSGDKVSHVWWLGDNANPEQVSLLHTQRGFRGEGMALGATPGELYLTSDNGGTGSSQLIKIKVPLHL